MFERFTERARQSVILAQEEARQMGHREIGNEHLLLGLLREEEGLAARILGDLRVGIDAVRDRVADVDGLNPAIEGTAQIPFESSTKKALELALREALSLGHNYIGTEHILLGLVREDSGLSSVVLREMGADPDHVRAAFFKRMSESKRERPTKAIRTVGEQRAEALAAVLHEIILRPHLAVRLAHRGLADDDEAKGGAM